MMRMRNAAPRYDVTHQRVLCCVAASHDRHFQCDGVNHSMNIIHRIFETIGGLWELMRIGVMSRFGGGRAYWNWRRETAFGHENSHVKSSTKSLTSSDKRRAVMRFGTWVFRMKRFR